jgi:hypothetical protein
MHAGRSLSTRTALTRCRRAADAVRTAHLLREELLHLLLAPVRHVLRAE